MARQPGTTQTPTSQKGIVPFAAEVLNLIGLVGGEGGQFARDLLSSPFFGQAETRAAGEGLTRVLEADRPQLGKAPATGAFFDAKLPGGGRAPVSLPGITERAIAERFETFNELTELGEEQRGVINRFRSRVSDTSRGLQEVDRYLQSVGLSSNVQLRRGLHSISRLRGTTLAFMAAGLRKSDAMISEIRVGNAKVLADIDTDISGRMANMVTGIEARGKAMFNETQRAMESVAPLAPDERAALRGYFNAQTASDVALGAGQLHAEAVAFRGQVATDLQTSFASTTAYVQASNLGLLGTGLQTLQGAEAMASDFRLNHVNTLKEVTIARSELRQFAASFTDQTSRTMFDMVSNMTRPVLVFSDILGSVFDVAFDVNAFNNNVEQLELGNTLAIASPQFEGVLAAVNFQATDRRAAEQRDFITSEGSKNRTTALASAAIGAAGSAFAPRTPTPAPAATPTT